MPSKNLSLLILIGLLFGFAIVFPAFWLNLHVFHLQQIAPYIIIALPIIAFFISMPFKGIFTNFIANITNTKYSHRFPIRYNYDLCEPSPIECRFYQTDAVRKIMRPGDILIRRYDYYLDGLIFGQACYFMHIAICIDEEHIMDAVGSKGVSRRHISEFARCDDIAVLRFNVDSDVFDNWLAKKHHLNPTLYTEEKILSLANLNKSKSVSTNQKQESSKYYHFIDDITVGINQDIDDANTHLLGTQEIEMFNNLQSDLQKNKIPTANFEGFIKEVVIGLAKAYEGTSYDYDFNFKDSKKLSCVEFIWDCYKALFPLHRIRRKVYQFFGIIRSRILVPDMFLVSDFFMLEYNSVNPDYNEAKTNALKSANAKELYKIINKRRTNFFTFTLKIVACQQIILGIFYLIKRYF